MKWIPTCFRLSESKTAIQNEMVSYSVGAEWTRVGQYYNCIQVSGENALVKERKLIEGHKNCNGPTLENYYTAPRMDATNWFLSGLYGLFDKQMQQIWNSMDLVLGQFMLTPVAAYSSVSWSQRMPKGIIKKDQPQCKLMEGFQETLVGLQTRSIVVSAGSTSYSCTNAVLAKKITDAFSNPGSEVDFFCDGSEWNVGKCGKGGEIAIGNHTEKQVCRCDPDLSIRPCIDNDNWGGAGGACSQDTITLSVVVYYGTSFAPTPEPTYSPTTIIPTQSPTEEPTNAPIIIQTQAPTGVQSANPTVMPTANATQLTEYSTSAPSATQRQISDPSHETNALNDFDRIDKDGNGVLNYEEIIFDIADVNKDGDISRDEYLAARADGLFRDTSSNN